MGRELFRATLPGVVRGNRGLWSRDFGGEGNVVWGNWVLTSTEFSCSVSLRQRGWGANEVIIRTSIFNYPSFFPFFFFFLLLCMECENI